MEHERPELEQNWFYVVDTDPPAQPFSLLHPLHQIRFSEKHGLSVLSVVGATDNTFTRRENSNCTLLVKVKLALLYTVNV